MIQKYLSKTVPYVAALATALGSSVYADEKQKTYDLRFLPSCDTFIGKEMSNICLPRDYNRGSQIVSIPRTEFPRDTSGLEAICSEDFNPIRGNVKFLAGSRYRIQRNVPLCYKEPRVVTAPTGGENGSNGTSGGGRGIGGGADTGNGVNG